VRTLAFSGNSFGVLLGLQPGDLAGQGLGVDHVVEVGGAGALTRSFGAIRVGGKISLIGGLSGPATELNPGLILARRANLQGILVGSMQMFEVINHAITANGIKPVIDTVFGFDEVHAAYKHMASGAHFGRIVIHVAYRATWHAASWFSVRRPSWWD
jgi:NADPH:quinone reductase-like Zn-dependent oxidoreductase